MSQKIEQYSYSIKKAKQRKRLSVFLLILFIFVFVNLIINFLIFPVRQNSDSMIPDVPDTSFLMVTPLVKTPKRGDVVLLKPEVKDESSFSVKAADLFSTFFTFQNYSLKVNPSFPGTQCSLRRVVGLPGDTFYIRDYVMYIKPKGEKHFLTEFELCNHPYNVTFNAYPASWDTSIGIVGYSEEYTLKDNEYFVLADNRFSCTDSRLSGPVTVQNIRGKALFCYFPFNKLKLY